MLLTRLNPYFNGTCSKRGVFVMHIYIIKDLNPYFNGTCSKSRHGQNPKSRILRVLILILMEHAQRVVSLASFIKSDGLNPYFNGTCSKSDGVKGVSGQPMS